MIFSVRLFGFLILLGLSLSSLAAPISKEAQSVIWKVHVAAKQQDTVALKVLMVPEFVWSFGGDSDAVQAIQSWEADRTSFKYLYLVTGKDCALKADKSIECPKNAGVGYRAGFKQTPVGWRMIYFVAGD